jgi:hypothetical protein
MGAGAELRPKGEERMTYKQAIIGLVATQRQAERILTALEGAGLARDDVSVLFCAEASRGVGEADPTRSPAIAVGFGQRPALGAGLASRGGLGIVVVPGAGSFIASGPILAALSGEWVGAGSRSIATTLIEMGTREHEARQYEEKLVGGRVLVAVHVDEHEERVLAKAVLQEGRAADVSSAGEHSVWKQSNSAPHSIS